jgi:3-dehydroquinate synthase
MVMAATMSGIAESDQRRLRSLVDAAGLPSEPPAVGSERLKEAMRLDKKVLSNKLRFVLLRELGDAFVTSDYGPDELDAVLSVADR